MEPTEQPESLTEKVAFGNRVSITDEVPTIHSYNIQYVIYGLKTFHQK